MLCSLRRTKITHRAPSKGYPSRKYSLIHKSSLMTVPFEDLKEKSRECIPHLEYVVISKVNQLTFFECLLGTRHCNNVFTYFNSQEFCEVI